MIYAFGCYELDSDAYELRRAGALVPAQRRVFDLLAFLVRRGSVVTTYAQLIAHVWEGTVVSRAAVAQAICGVRLLLEDDDAHPQYIGTVRGRGYRFLAEVEQRNRPRYAPVEYAPLEGPQAEIGTPEHAPATADERARATAAQIVEHLRTALRLCAEMEGYRERSDALVDRALEELAGTLARAPESRRSAVATRSPRHR